MAKFKRCSMGLGQNFLNEELTALFEFVSIGLLSKKFRLTHSVGEHGFS